MFTTLTWIDLGVIISATAATAAIARMFSTPAHVQTPTFTSEKPLSFEFNLDGTLVCSNVEGSAFLAGLKLTDPDWPALRDALSTRFSDLPMTLNSHEEPKVSIISARTKADPILLDLRHHANGLTLLIKRRNDVSENNLSKVHEELSSLKDLALVKAASESAPFPVWQTNRDGSTGWSNAFYQRLDQRITTESGQLFDVPHSQDTNGRAIRMTL